MARSTKTPEEKRFLEAKEALQEELDQPGEITGTKAVDAKGKPTTSEKKAVKRDDQGAIDQLRTAGPADKMVEYDEARRALPTTWVEKGGSGSLSIRSHRELDQKVNKKGEVTFPEVDTAAASDMDLWLHGEGFDRGEVQYDIINHSNGSRVRFATWVDTEDGEFAVQLTNILPGNFEVVAYHTRSDYEQGDPLRRQVMEEVDRVSIAVGA
jgi:hypothetical protein